MPFVRMQTLGNLASYKAYVLPMARNRFGYHSEKSKYQENVQTLLHTLFTHGTCTTWDIAKTKYYQTSKIRNQDKILRRLLVGRSDRGRYSGGLIDSGLVVGRKAKPFFRYRLTLYGILYCLDALNPTKKDQDTMAENYSFLLPRVFGDWKKKKKILREDAYNLRVLSQGILLNNIQFARPDSPLYELMMYLHVKYSKNFETISESDLSEQTSYWFYTFLLYSAPKKLSKTLSSDGDLFRWYESFFKEAQSYYAQRLRSIKNSSII
ncbi:MAG: hypothetical protein OXC46_09770 [Thaumarchaeota archaeon]|nr:hypothetical protein [Nitrososphaerota archaeon]